METSTFAAFIAAAIPGFFTPGPNNLMLMASSAKFGFRRTIPHGLGVSIGFALMVVLVGLGLGEVFRLVPWLEPVLKVLAAINLLYLAWTLLGLKIKDEGTGERTQHRSGLSENVMREGAKDSSPPQRIASPPQARRPPAGWAGGRLPTGILYL